MAHLIRLAREYSLTVIEDNAENLGAEYQGKQADRHGLDECLSVNGNRVVTCGGGEMALMDERKFAERAHYLTTQANDNPFENIHGAIRLNYRLTNMQATLGVAQIQKIDNYVAKKRRLRWAIALVWRMVPGLRIRLRRRAEFFCIGSAPC